MIYVNGRFLINKPTGIENFAYGMCKAMHDNGIEFVILTPKSQISHYDINDFKILKIGLFTGPLWEQIDLSFYMIKKNHDILISFSGIGSVLIKNQIITIHDIALFTHPEWFSKLYRILYNSTTPIIVKKAKAIITVSEFSKKEIVNYFGVSPDKIIVTYSAPKKLQEFDLINLQDYSYNHQKPYILAVSSIDPRKNFRMLIDAFLKSKISYNLLIIGKKHKSFKDYDVEIESDKIHFLGYVSKEELIYYYRHATAFVSVSLYEGFGLPPIEAMSLGCPVVVSDLDVCHEVCKEAAYYVNPEDIDSVVSGLRKISEDVSLRESLVRKGNNISREYTFDNSLKRLFTGLSTINSCLGYFK